MGCTCTSLPDKYTWRFIPVALWSLWIGRSTHSSYVDRYACSGLAIRYIGMFVATFTLVLIQSFKCTATTLQAGDQPYISTVEVRERNAMGPLIYCWSNSFTRIHSHYHVDGLSQCRLLLSTQCDMPWCSYRTRLIWGTWRTVYNAKVVPPPPL